MPEFKNPVIAKTSQKRSFSIIENERSGHVFARTGSINSVTVPTAPYTVVFYIMERLGPGHLYPKLEVPRMTCLGRESNTGLRGGRLPL
jgi:hypothetical protein